MVNDLQINHKNLKIFHFLNFNNLNIKDCQANLYTYDLISILKIKETFMCRFCIHFEKKSIISIIMHVNYSKENAISIQIILLEVFDYCFTFF